LWIKNLDALKFVAPSKPASFRLQSLSANLDGPVQGAVADARLGERQDTASLVVLGEVETDGPLTWSDRVRKNRKQSLRAQPLLEIRIALYEVVRRLIWSVNSPRFAPRPTMTESAPSGGVYTLCPRIPANMAPMRLTGIHVKLPYAA
jgi:hypothetical protein